jgi:tetratricopeptide (TPR) repeat protein
LKGWKKRGLSRSETIALARSNARTALQLDDSLAEAHASLASISYVYDWDWSLAEKEFQRAIELSPNYATAHHWYAYYCFSRNRIEEGLQEIRIAQQLDPHSLIIQNDVGQLLYEARRYDEAIEEERRTLDMDEDLSWPHLWLGLSYLAKQQNREAIAELQTYVRLSGAEPGAMALLGMAYARSGRLTEAKEVLQKIRELPLRKYDSTAEIAFLFEALGQKDQAYAWLEKILADRPTPLKSLHVLPYLDPLRSDPRFQALQRRVGLP